MIDAVVDGRVGRIRMDRPGRRNALTSEGLDALEAAVVELVDNAAVLYLQRTGEAFCAGADLDEVAGLGRERAAELAERGQWVARTIADSPVSVVAGDRRRGPQGRAGTRVGL